jgi:hypothetical protein
VGDVNGEFVKRRSGHFLARERIRFMVHETNWVPETMLAPS